MCFLKRVLPLLCFFALSLFIHSCTDSVTEPEFEDTPFFNSQAAPGDSAKSFLENDQYTTLNIEIDYMEGYEPTAEALDSLQVFLERHLNKSSITIGVPNSITAAGQNAYTVDDVAALEEQHRDHYTEAESDTLWAYFLILDGEYSQQNVLGIAYYNTSMALFGETIDAHSGPPPQPSTEKMEATVLRHEMGHILGLVDNGTDMVQDHKDSAHGHHCTEESCLMYYAVETTDYFANIFDGNIPDLLQYCSADLEANGGK